MRLEYTEGRPTEAGCYLTYDGDGWGVVYVRSCLSGELFWSKPDEYGESMVSRRWHARFTFRLPEKPPGADW